MSTFTPSSRVILFPGLGADPRMFTWQREELPWIETPAWIAHEPGESLRRYAARFGESLNVREPVVLGGVSMGGMLALEMSRVVPTKVVIQIASCAGPHAINPLMRAFEGISRPMPSAAIDRGRVLGELFLGRGGGLPTERRCLLVRMLRDLPVDFLRWAARAIMTWEGCPSPGAPIKQIHGDRDWVIPFWRVKPDRTVPRGMHVLNVSHPAEVNAFVRECVDGAERR